MKNKEAIINWLKVIGMILVTSIIGVVLLSLVYMLPSDKMAKNVAESKEVLKEQNDEIALEQSGFFNYYDTGTNIIILHEVIYPNRGQAVADAMLAPTANYFQKNLDQWIENLISHASNREYGQNDTQSYARYWHGYLVLLKPLFLFFNLSQIYVLNTIVLLVLTGIVIAFMYKKLGKMALAYVFVVTIMNPEHIFKSFQLSAIYYALCIVLILLLRNYKNDNKDRMILVFAISGMWVVFFDFLTYPLVALSIPLLVFALLNRTDKLMNQIIYMIRNSVAFVMGYGGLWIMKWVFASLLTEENVIRDGINNTLHRVGAKEMSEDVLFDDSPINAIKVNVDTIINKQTLMICIVFACVLFVYMLVKREKLRVDFKVQVLSLIIMLSPFAWYVVVHNHCALHPHLEWRELAISFFAIGVMMLDLKGKEL